MSPWHSLSDLQLSFFRPVSQPGFMRPEPGRTH